MRKKAGLDISDTLVVRSADGLELIAEPWRMEFSFMHSDGCNGKIDSEWQTREIEFSPKPVKANTRTHS